MWSQNHTLFHGEAKGTDIIINSWKLILVQLSKEYLQCQILIKLYVLHFLPLNPRFLFLWQIFLLKGQDICRTFMHQATVIFILNTVSTKQNLQNLNTTKLTEGGKFSETCAFSAPHCTNGISESLSHLWKWFNKRGCKSRLRVTESCNFTFSPSSLKVLTYILLADSCSSLKC